MDTNEITFGTDPEFWMVDSKDFCVPPIAIEREYGIKPVKDDVKHPVYIDTGKWYVMMDGAAFEIGLKQPHKDSGGIYYSIQEALAATDKLASKLNLNTLVSPVVKFDPQKHYVDKDEKYQQAVIFGCDPDKDIFDINYECKTIDVSNHGYRYGGGHWHVGHRDPRIVKIMQANIEPAIKLLAIFVGNTVVSRCLNPELERQRGEYYGKAGRFRTPPHGIEYRTPSNSWISNRYTIEDMIRATRTAMYWLFHPNQGGKMIIDTYAEPTIQAINSTDRRLASDILNKVNGY